MGTPIPHQNGLAQARARGGYIAESSFLVRAASLTPDRQRKADRLLLAAHAAFLAGNAGYSESLLEEARPHLGGPFERAQAQRLDGDLRFPLGQTHLAPSLLLAAARAFEPLDRVLVRGPAPGARPRAPARAHPDIVLVQVGLAEV